MSLNCDAKKVEEKKKKRKKYNKKYVKKNMYKAGSEFKDEML
jgi:hypothetical protein